jgi:glycosyltransferase involved in cell wall biosynthesis
MSKNILIFSPFAAWRLHFLHELTIAIGLKLRGHNITIANCDAVFTRCILHGNFPPSEVCRDCVSASSNFSYMPNILHFLFKEVEIPQIWISKFLDAQDKYETEEWVKSLKDDELITALYKGYPIGKWVKSTLHSLLQMKTLNLSDPNVSKAYREILIDGALALEALTRILDNYKPDIILEFNGRFYPHRICLELAKERNIRCIIHERGRIPDSISLWENEICHSYSFEMDLWNKVKDKPLSEEQLRKIHRFFMERRLGGIKMRDWNQGIISKPKQSSSGGLEQILLKEKNEKNRKIVAVFTTSEVEMADSQELGWWEIFPNQLEWVKETIEYFRAHPDLLGVVRLHPHHLHADHYFLESVKQLISSGLPENVKFVMPDDNFSSYFLMEIADCGVVYASTAGLEMAALGKPVLVCAGTFYAGTSFVETLNTPENYFDALDKLIWENPSRERKRMAYRFAYYYYISRSIPFSYFTLTDQISGVCSILDKSDLLPGKDKYFDNIIDFILGEKKLFEILNIDEVDGKSASLESEDRFFDTIERNAKKTNRPAISIIVPVDENQLTRIDMTIKSIAKQNFKDFEILVIDYSSKSQSGIYGKIIEYKKNFDRFYYYKLFQENNGREINLADAINFGIYLSSGNFIHFIYPGDMVFEDFYTKILEAFRKYPEIFGVYSDALIVDDSGKTLGKAQLPDFNSEHVFDRGRFMLSCILSYPIISSCAVARTECYEIIGNMRREFDQMCDYDMWIRIGENFPLYHIKETLVGCQLNEPAIRYMLGNIHSSERERIKEISHQIIKDFRKRHKIFDFLPYGAFPTNQNAYKLHMKLREIFIDKGFLDLAEDEINEAKKVETLIEHGIL